MHGLVIEHSHDIFYQRHGQIFRERMAVRVRRTMVGEQMGKKVHWHTKDEVTFGLPE